MQAWTQGATANPSPCSLNIDAVGPIALRDNRGVTLSSSVILSGTRCLAVKDNANNYFRLIWPHHEHAGADNVLTTEGDILYQDASGLQRLAIGTADQVLAVNSGATAPEYVDPPTDFQFVSTAAITAAATLTVTGMAAGFDYKVVLEAFAPNTDSDELWMRFSDDAGVSYEADASDYGWQARLSSLDQSSAADTKMAITGTGGSGTSLGNDAGNVNSVEITIPTPNASSEKTTCYWHGVLMGDAATPATVLLSGGAIFQQGADAVAAVQLLWSSGGNFKAQGDITVWRRKRS